MKKQILTFLVALIASFGSILSAQVSTPPVIIHGEGSIQFFVCAPEGFYEIQSYEIWLNSDGSETFESPVYNSLPGLNDHDNNPYPVGRMTCGQARNYAHNGGGSAECGPTIKNTVGTKVTFSCANSDAWMCKLSTYRSDGSKVTLWGVEGI